MGVPTRAPTISHTGGRFFHHRQDAATGLEKADEIQLTRTNERVGGGNTKPFRLIGAHYVTAKNESPDTHIEYTRYITGRNGFCSLAGGPGYAKRGKFGNTTFIRRVPFGGTTKISTPEACSLRASRRSVVSNPSPAFISYQRHCRNSSCSFQRHVCHPRNTYIPPMCPDLTCYPQRCLGFESDLPVCRVSSRDNLWDLESNSDGGVRLDSDENEVLANSTGSIPPRACQVLIIEQTAAIIEDLPLGYDADTEDGGNGYQSSYDGDNYDGINDSYSGDQDSEDTIQVWEFAPGVSC